MRYLIKGGVWKNSEDEILKAAVMKYGLNQWSRISSLLVRKSANQCKQRWYEWLDPSIKKTEWTREEEEKLLHLAKIFPQQWRTISPLVGRTPQQCFDQYERLLDKAQGRDSQDPNDPRKLKPGEIDPNPEAKPPRPDPIDMDEDEKEMLAEARVRLANTKGKKAKRKQREKMIEESRRLAQLQKKRELKAAGIDYLQEFKKKKKKKGIQDYNAEVIFERLVPDYIYDTDASETPKPQNNFQTLSFHDIENKNRLHEDEIQKKIDQKRIKKLKDQDMGRALEILSQDQNYIKNQSSKLILPDPQLQDKDLELLGKMNQVQEVSNLKNQATQALIGNYSQREVSMTPMRTPMAQDQVMREARNAIALQQVDTPLIGGQNPELEENLATKQPILNSKVQTSQQPQTPNVLQQMIKGSTMRGMTSHTPMMTQPTPLSSHYQQTPSMMSQSGKFIGEQWEEDQSQLSGINDLKLQQMRLQAQRQALKDSLLNMPKPKNDYQIEVPDIEAEIDEDQDRIIDQEEIEARKQEQLAIEAQKKLRQRSLALQLQMPRPFVIPYQIYDHIHADQSLPPQRIEAETMLEQEMINILSFDAQTMPFHGSKPMNFQASLENFTEQQLAEAEKLLMEEIEVLKKEKPLHGYMDKHQEMCESIVLDVSKKQILDLNDCDEEEKNQYLLYQAQQRKNIFLREQKKLEQIENKQRVMTKGYQNVIMKNIKEIDNIYAEIEDRAQKLQVYQQAYTAEQRSIQQRMDELRQYHAKLEFQNSLLIQREKDLLAEKEELLQEPELFNPQQAQEQNV